MATPFHTLMQTNQISCHSRVAFPEIDYHSKNDQKVQKLDESGKSSISCQFAFEARLEGVRGED
jgi:hypothetical protein